MAHAFRRTAGTVLVTAMLLALAACFMNPGKFTSTLDIRADRSFTFTYKGEVIVTDMSELSGKADKWGGDDEDSGDEDGSDDGSAPETMQKSAIYQQIAHADEDKGDIGDETSDTPEKLAKMQEIADALSKEEGYRSVRYAGNNKFEIDYQLSGKLDHSFLFPFNIDAQAPFPFVAIEVRKDGRIRVQAPGFAESKDGKAASAGMASAAGTSSGSPEREGSFTLTTDAEIISQNQEDGATTTPRGKQIVWKITPYTRVAPMAVLKLAAGK